MLNAIRFRIVEIRALASRVAPACAAPLRAVVVENARTKRGNVPLYVGPLSTVALPITVVATGATLTIRAVDWSMRQMIAKGSPAEWLAVIATVARNIREGR